MNLLQSIEGTSSALNIKTNGHPTNGAFTFAFSRFDGKNDNTPKAARLDWRGLVALLKRRSIRDAKDGPLISGASYPPGAPRGNAGVSFVSLAILDFDGGAQIESIEAGVSRLNSGNGGAAFVYSTHSHEPGAGAFKYRLVLPLLEPVAGADWPQVWKRLALHFDGAPDPKAKDAARIHYLPSCPQGRELDAVALELDGQPLDVKALPELPTDTPTTPYIAPETRGGDVYARRAFDAEIGRLCATGSNRNDALNQTARRLGQFIGAGRLDRLEVEAALLNAATANGYVSKDGEAQARATMKSGLDAGEREPNRKGEPEQRNGARPGKTRPTVTTDKGRSDSSEEERRDGEEERRDGEEERRDGEEEAPRWTFTTLSELRARPRPLWLIRDILIEATAVVLSGDSQSFKTFSALDMALCVATGTDWHGREVKRGPVIYIAAEGGWTLRDRLEAWEIARGIEAPENFHLLEVPVTIGDPATVAAFADFIESKAPRLVVIDTLSACAEGLKENASEDMATFVRHMKAIARATGATVIVIHHNNKGGDLRGAVSLKNDSDTHIAFERSGEEEELLTVVSCSKHRGAHFPKFALRGERFELSEPDEYGRPVSSLIFEECDLPEGEEKKPHPNTTKGDKTRERLLDIFEECEREFPDGVKVGTWAGQSIKTKETPNGICADKTFWRERKIADKVGEIIKVGTRDGSDIFKRARPTVTTVITVKSSSDSNGHNAPKATVTTVTIPLGSDSSDSSDSGAKKDSAPTRKKRAKNSAESEPYGAAPSHPKTPEVEAEAEEGDDF